MPVNNISRSPPKKKNDANTKDIQKEITELDIIRFKEILRRDIYTAESIAEESDDNVFKKRGKEDAEVVTKFLTLLENAISSPSSLPSPTSPSPSSSTFLSEISKLREDISTLRYEQAKDRQRIAALELYFNSKNNGHRDFDLLAVELLKKLANRKRMDYKDILNSFNFKSHEEAYRLMKKIALKFPYEAKIIHKKIGHNKTKRVLVYIGDRP